MRYHTLTTASLLAALATPALAHPHAEQAEPHARPRAAELVELAPPAAVEEAAPGRSVVVARRIVLDDQGNRVILEGDDRGQGVRVLMLDQPAGDNAVELDADHVFLGLTRARDGAPGAVPADAPRVEVTYLGVNCEPLDFDTAKVLGLDKGTGLNVNFVAEDSPAREAGLKVGDVLTRLDDQLLVNPEQLAVLVRTHEAGEIATLHVFREGEAIELRATLGTTKLAELGPGGRNLTRAWRVQQNDPFGGGLIAPPAAGADPFIRLLPPADPEEAVPFDHPAAPDEVRAMIEMMRQQLDAQRGRMQQQRDEMDQMLQQMRQHLELDLQGMRGGLIEQPGLPGGAMQMRSQMSWNDNAHSISITTDGNDQLLTVKTHDGEVLYDDALPADNRAKRLRSEGLTDDVIQKIERLLTQTETRFAPGGPVPEQQPAQPPLNEPGNL